MSADATPLARQLSYFRERTHALAARLFQADRQTSLLRHELEQKRRGFALLARLSAELRPVDADQALHQVASQLGAALAMPRTLVLQPDGDGDGQDVGDQHGAGDGDAVGGSQIRR